MVSLISPLIKKKIFGTTVYEKKNILRAFYGILWCCLKIKMNILRQ